MNVNDIVNNIVLNKEISLLIFLFISLLYFYGRAQYLRGYIRGKKDGAHELEKLNDQWSCGWIDEAEEWRRIIKEIVEKLLIQKE